MIPDVPCPKCGALNDARFAECAKCKAALPAATEPPPDPPQSGRPFLALAGALAFLGGAGALYYFQPEWLPVGFAKPLVQAEIPAAAPPPAAAPAPPPPPPPPPPVAAWADYLSHEAIAVQLPAKPESSGFLSGGSLHWAKLEPHDYLVAELPAPAGQEEEALRALRAELARLLGGVPTPARSITIDNIPASEFEIIGEKRGGTARAVAWDNKIFALAAASPKGQADPAAQKIFFESFKVK